MCRSSILVLIFYAVLACGVCAPSAKNSFAIAAEEIKDETPPDAKRVEDALRLWFDGNIDNAESELTALVDAKTSNPVPYHALAVLLNDKKADYTKVTRLYSRHRGLIPKGKESYKAIMPLLDEYALTGNVQALLMQGRIKQTALDGRGGLANAMLAFRRASDGGYAPAQRELGFMYEMGLGVVEDDKEAERLYSLSAVQGYPAAMTNLAVMYINGDVAKSKKEFALKLLHEAADMHYADAEIVLAKMYREGVFLKKNKQKSFEHFTKAAEYGSSDAMGILGWVYETGQSVEKSPELAVKWYREAAECGNDNALFRLGVLYYTGTFVKEDHEEAFKNFKMSAELGNVGAWFNVAILYINGDGVERDAKAAKVWFERSARMGNAEAQANLGIMYANGDGVSADFEEAYFWLSLAKLCGDDNTEGLKSVGEKLDDAARDRAQRKAITVRDRLLKRGFDITEVEDDK